MFKPSEYLLQKAIDYGNLQAALEIGSKTGSQLTNEKFAEIAEQAAEHGDLPTVREAMKMAGPDYVISDSIYEKIIAACVVNGETEQAVAAAGLRGRPLTNWEIKRLLDLSVAKDGLSKTLEHLHLL